MEYQTSLEIETPVAETGGFIRAVERLTGRDIFPCIDAAAEAAKQDLSGDLLAETERAYRLGRAGKNYIPEVEYWGTELPFEVNTFLNKVYEAGTKEAPQKPRITSTGLSS